MAGTFDSNVGSLDFFESSIASTVASVNAAQIYAIPYDVEIVAASIVGTPAAAAQYIWADVQKTPVGTTTAVSLFSRPAPVANLASAKVDQSYVTFTTATVATSTLSNNIAAGTTATVASATNFAVGQGVVISGSNVTANYITAISSNTLTLAKAVTAATSATVSVFTSVTPQTGQQVQILAITDTFFKVLNNTATVGAPALTAYNVVDSSESTTAQTFRVGPLKQAGLYDTTTGFWKFTTDKTSLSAGTYQIFDAVVLPGAASGQTVATYNAPDVSTTVPAGAKLSVVWRAIDSSGVTRTTTATATNIALNLVIKKI
jgi:hypothetical protein